MCFSGVGIMYISGLFLAVITIIYLVLGVSIQWIACDTFRNYKDSQIIGLIDDSLNIKDTVGVDLSMKNILANCHRNKSIYHVFNLEHTFNLSSIQNYIEEYNIRGSLEDFEYKLLSVDLNVVILSNETKQQLINLANTGISDINFDKFQEVVSM